MPSLKTILPILASGALVVGAFAFLNASTSDTPKKPGCDIPPPNPTPDNTPVSKHVAPTGLTKVGDTLTLKTRLSHPYFPLQDGPFQAHAQLDVDAIEAVKSPNVPLDVAVVIDCSGSMNGDKMINARIAAQDFIMRLRSGDRATLIKYSNNVETVVAMTTITDDSKRVLQRAIGSLTPVGGTNIHSALQHAQNAFQSLPNNANRVRRVLLLSDGRATAGITNPKNITEVASNTRQRGVTISTLGLGDDYQEVLMTNIAEKGGGNYYFISDSSTLSSTFEREFATLQTSLARDTSVTLKPAPGVTITKVHGFSYNTDAAGIVHIPLGEFWSKRNASIVVDLSIGKRPANTTQPVFTTQLSYNDLTTSKPKAHTTTLSALATANTASIDQHLDAEVIVRADQLKTAATTQEAMQIFESGDRDRALQMIKKRKDDMAKTRTDLQAKGKDTASNKYLFEAMDREEAEGEDMVKSLEAAPSPASSTGKKLLKRNRAKAYGKSRLNSF